MSTRPFKQISVLEPDLRSVGSHHFEYAQLLNEAAASAGASLRVFGNHDVSTEVRSLTNAEPLFHDPSGWLASFSESSVVRSAPPLHGFLMNFVRNRQAARDLSRAFGGLNWEGLLILVPNCHQGLAEALGHRLREPLRRHPTARAVLVFPFVPGKHLFQQTFRALVPLVRAGQVALATDSEPLAELYRRLTGFTFTVLPMPYGAGAPGEARVATGATRFLACGGYRMEKGIDLLAGLIEGLESDLVADEMSFTLQGFGNDTAPDPEAARHFARIKAVAARCPPGSITVIETVLSSAEYHRLFAGCDAAILPYRQGAYAIRTSGVLTECLARGKPVIATADTWPGQQVQAHGAGLTFPDGDAGELARAVRRLHAERDTFAADAMARRAAWLAFHNPDNYLRALITLARGGGTDQASSTRR